MVESNNVSKDHYYYLSSDIEAERIKGAVNLINELQKTDDTREWNYSLNRLIKGLSSTRASARIGYSTALSEILNILFTDSKITVEDYFKTLEEQLKLAKAGNKGRDERAYMFGRLFGLKSLANSNLFLEESSDSTFDKNFYEFVEQILNLSTLKSWINESSFYTLFELVRKLIISKKLSDENVILLLVALNGRSLTLTPEGLSIYFLLIQYDKSHIFNKLPFSNGWKENNPLLKSNLQSIAKILKNSEIQNLNDDLEDISRKDIPKKNKAKNGKPKKSNSSTQSLHFVWKLIIDIVINIDLQDIDTGLDTASSKKRKKTSDKKFSKKQKVSKDSSEDLTPRDCNLVTIKDFWKVAVEDSLFSLKSSPEKKLWGFRVFVLILQDFLSVSQGRNDDVLKGLFTENFLRTLINQSNNNNSLLNNFVKLEILNGCIIDYVALDPKNVTISILLMKNLLFSSYSNINFDAITSTKTTESLLNNISMNGSFEDLTVVSKLFLDVINDPLAYINSLELKQLLALRNEAEDTEEELKKVRSKLIEKKQKWAVNQISVLLKQYKVRVNKKPEEENKKPLLNEWVDGIIKCFVSYGFFKPVKSTETYNSVVSDVILKKLNSLLFDILSLKRIDNGTWVYVALKESYNLETEQKKSKGLVPLIELDKDLNKVKFKHYRLLNQIIRKKQQSDSSSPSFKKLASFELIYSIILLQFYSDSSSLQDSIAILEEIDTVYKKFYVSEEIKDDDIGGDFNDLDAEVDLVTELSIKDADLNGSNGVNNKLEDYESIDILLEIILSFIHKKSQLFKKLSMIIWETFIKDLQYLNLKNFYDILLVKENVEGQKSLFNNNDEEEEDIEEDFDDEEEEDFDDDDDELEDINEDTKDFLDKLDKKTTTDLAKALKIPADDANVIAEVSKKESSNNLDDDDGGSSDRDQSSSSKNDLSNSNSSSNSDADEDEEESGEESMDDEQMMAVDHQLSMIFKHRQSSLQTIKTSNKRKEEKLEAMENMGIIKSRILDLLDVYVDKISNAGRAGNYSGSLNDEKYIVISLIDPLLGLMNLTINGSLREKAYKLLKKINKIKIVFEKDSSNSSKNNDKCFVINEKSIFDLIANIQDNLEKTSMTSLASAQSQCSLFLSKIMIQYDRNNAGKIIDIYSNTMKNWAINDHCKVQPSVFYDLVNYFSSVKQNKSTK